jgi:hypothetical protein
LVHRRKPLQRLKARLPSNRLSRRAQLDTPDSGLNQAFAWAVDKAGSAVRAEEGSGIRGWDGSDLGHLLSEGWAFERVGPEALPDPAGFLREVVAGLFGAAADQAGGRFALSPWLVPGWRRMALRRLRMHRTVVDVDVRPRAEWVTVRVEVTFGPPVPVAVSVRNGGRISRVTVDDVVLDSERVVFTVSGEHEVMFFYQGEAA